MDRGKIIAGNLRKKGRIEIPCLWNDYLTDKARCNNRKLVMTDIKRDLELNEIGKDKILVPDVFRKGGTHEQR